MNLKLERPICFFDLETTGVSVSESRVVSISVIKLFPDGTTEGKSILVNPTIPIPKVASEIHLITNEMVIEAPSFRNISKGVLSFFEGCDIAGYNSNNFDVPILSEEFLRCGIDFPNPETRCIDVFNIFKKKEGRDLKSAVKFYCGKELEDAHSSDADTIACKDVFLAQLEKYEDLKNMTVDELVTLSKMDNRVDFAGHIIKDADGDLAYNFGKSKGEKMKNNTGFGNWMLNQAFVTEQTKKIVRKELAKIINSSSNNLELNL
jgi:DNA polymerase-3 subunit epsilon